MNKTVPALALGAALLGVVAVRAQTATPAEQTGTPGNPATTPAEAPYVAPKDFGEWASSIKLGLQVDGGITVNPQDPKSRRNFGQLFNDDSNRPILNQLLATISRDVNPKATENDYGFKLQLAYGSDSRITHTLGVFDQLIHNRNQLDVPEASLSVRLPAVFANGLDLKAGIYPTPLGVELIDPKTNAFYSHSYIFNYGLPFKHTGVLATAHVSDLVDLYAGVDTGTNTFLAYGAGDNNNRPGGIAGIGLNINDGKLVFLALSHMGPEDSKLLVPYANSAMRYYNDVSLVWKATDALTLTTEVNYVRETGYNVEAYGITQYASYTLNDQLTLNGRAEIFRDEKNFFVSTPVGERDYVAAERGTFSRFLTATKNTTYSEFTAGLTYKPAGVPSQLSTLLIRPEVRYDRTLNNSRPFNDNKDRGAFTLAADVILGF